MFILFPILGENITKIVSCSKRHNIRIFLFLIDTIFPFVTTEEELLEILKDALKRIEALVVSTLVSKQLITAAKEFGERTGLLYL